MIAILLFIASANPPECVLVAHVDTVEFNELWECNGKTLKLTLSQVIFWDYVDIKPISIVYPVKRELHVIHWKSVQVGNISILPDACGVFTYKPPGHGQFDVQLNYLLFHEGPILRKVYFKGIIHTITDDDPEVEDRKAFPIEYRRRLGEPRSFTDKPFPILGAVYP